MPAAHELDDPADLGGRARVLPGQLRNAQTREEMLDGDLAVNRVERAVGVEQSDDQRVMQPPTTILLAGLSNRTQPALL